MLVDLLLPPRVACRALVVTVRGQSRVEPAPDEATTAEACRGDAVCRLGGLEFSPAARAVVGGDLFEHRRQRSRLDLFSLAVGDRSGGLVGVAGGDDAGGVGDDAAVVEEEV